MGLAPRNAGWVGRSSESCWEVSLARLAEVWELRARQREQRLQRPGSREEEVQSGAKSSVHTTGEAGVDAGGSAGGGGPDTRWEGRSGTAGPSASIGS